MAQQTVSSPVPNRFGNSGVHANNAENGQRTLCPVAGCPESLESSTRYFTTFASIRIHLNDHCTGLLTGAVPGDFLRHFDYTQCSICDKILHKRYNGTCPKCRPRARTQEQVNTLRNRINLSDTNPLNNHHQNPNLEAQPELPSLLEIHKRYVPTIRNIPKGLRGLFAQCLNKALAQAVFINNETSWIHLQMLPKCTLCFSARGGKSHVSQRLAWTRGRLQRWLKGERTQLWQDIPQFKRPKHKQLSAEAAKIKRQERCIALTGEGGLSNACKALISPTPLGECAEVIRTLESKHPSATHPVNLEALGPARSSLVPLSDVAATEQCIRSFHRLSGGGPSGLKPIHLQNCLTTVHRDEVLERGTALTNILAKGEAPMSLAPFLAGANLTALSKKDNGIRPVAVGEVWRRLTAKCLCIAYKEQSSAFFFPQQIGVGQTLGTEVGLETARQWCKRNGENPNFVFVKIDFFNAFNCVHRQVFLEQCRQHFPGLSKWVEWCYSSPSNLYFGSNTMSSERGVQQGDPLGPLLFSLALQPILMDLSLGQTEQGLQLSYSYLDDLNLAGDQHVVANAFQYVRDKALEIGLEFNSAKCEVIPTAGHCASLDKGLFPADVIFRDDGNFELLGGPIGTDIFCNEHTKQRVDKAKEVLEALRELPDP